MKSKLLYLLIITFILNLIWEYSHYQLYIDLSGISKHPHLWLATFTDAIYITAFALIISLKNKTTKWLNKPKKLDYILFISLALITAIVIELINLNLGRWQYTSAMPTIFTIGLSPLLQLATTGILGLWIVRKI